MASFIDSFTAIANWVADVAVTLLAQVYRRHAEPLCRRLWAADLSDEPGEGVSLSV
ncbi:MAG: hypothetical protein ACRDQU_12365 [Pseudonocardiaceae bacterium]